MTTQVLFLLKNKKLMDINYLKAKILQNCYNVILRPHDYSRIEFEAELPQDAKSFLIEKMTGHFNGKCRISDLVIRNNEFYVHAEFGIECNNNDKGYSFVNDEDTDQLSIMGFTFRPEDGKFTEHLEEHRNISIFIPLDIIKVGHARHEGHTNVIHIDGEKSLDEYSCEIERLYKLFNEGITPHAGELTGKCINSKQTSLVKGKSYPILGDYEGLLKVKEGETIRFYETKRFELEI